MSVRVLCLFSTLLFLSCQEDPFPEGLYDYQAERLLSGGSEKIWLLSSSTVEGATTRPDACVDSLRLYITATPTDTITVAQLVPQTDCNAFDTLSLGMANASGDLLFTDSIYFVSGELWVINSVSSVNLTFTDSEEIQRWVAE